MPAAAAAAAEKIRRESAQHHCRPRETQRNFPLAAKFAAANRKRSSFSPTNAIYGQSRTVVTGEKILQGKEEVRNSSKRKEVENSSTRKPDLQVQAHRNGKESS